MLNELVANELQELQQEHKGFKVTDLESANWCFRKLRAIELQKTEFNLLAQKEIERIENWLNGELNKLEGQESFFNGLLTEYALEQRKENPKFKLSSPYGKVSFRKQQPKWNYEDEKVLQYLKDNDYKNLIRIKEEINKADLKKAAIIYEGNAVDPATGEVIPGILIEEQPEALKIDVEV